MNDVMRSLLQKLAAEKKKLVFMSMLAVVALLLWGRLFIVKQLPRSAVADPQVQAAASNSTQGQVPVVGRPTVYVDLPRTIQRNLFAIDPTHYERLRQAPVVPDPLPQQAVEINPPKFDIAESLRALELNATIGGAPSRAVINNQVVSPGETIQGFELIKVLNRRVVLRRDGVDVTLEM